MVLFSRKIGIRSSSENIISMELSLTLPSVPWRQVDNSVKWSRHDDDKTCKDGRNKKWCRQNGTKKMDFDWIKLHVASTPMKMKSRISPKEKFNIFVRILEEVFLWTFSKDVSQTFYKTLDYITWLFLKKAKSWHGTQYFQLWSISGEMKVYH